MSETNEERLQRLQATDGEWSAEERNALALFAAGYSAGATAERQTTVNLIREGIAPLRNLPDTVQTLVLDMLKSALTVLGIDFDWEDALKEDAEVIALNGLDGTDDAFEAWIEAGAPLTAADTDWGDTE